MPTVELVGRMLSKEEWQCRLKILGGVAAALLYGNHRSYLTPNSREILITPARTLC